MGRQFCVCTGEHDLKAGELRKSGLKIKLQQQPFQVRAMLLEQPGEMVTLGYCSINQPEKRIDLVQFLGYK